MSCGSPTFCVAIDGNQVIRFDGASWSAPQTVTTDGLVAVSCVASGFCMALTSDDALSYSGGAWTSTSLPGTDGPDAVSCSSATMCAVGVISASDDARAYIYNGTTWRSTDLGSTGSDDLAIVLSCVSPTFCLAADEEGSTARFDGTTWTFVDNVGDEDTYLSCLSTAFCLELDEGGSFTFDVTGWGQPASFIGQPYAFFPMRSISCASTTFCIGLTTSAQLVFYNGSDWTSRSK